MKNSKFIGHTIRKVQSSSLYVPINKYVLPDMHKKRISGSECRSPQSQDHAQQHHQGEQDAQEFCTFFHRVFGLFQIVLSDQ